VVSRRIVEPVGRVVLIDSQFVRIEIGEVIALRREFDADECVSAIIGQSACIDEVLM